MRQDIDTDTVSKIASPPNFKLSAVTKPSPITITNTKLAMIFPMRLQAVTV